MTPELVGSMAARTGVSSTKVRTGLTTATNGIMEGLAGKARDTSPMGSVVDLIDRTPEIEDPARLLDEETPIRSSGARLLNLATEDSPGMVKRLASTLGIGSGAASSLLGIAAGLVMSALRRFSRARGGLNAAALSSALIEEAPHWRAPVHEPDRVYRGEHERLPRERTVAHARGGEKKWLWLLALVPIILLGMWLFNRREHSEQPGMTTSKVTEPETKAPEATTPKAYESPQEVTPTTPQPNAEAPNTPPVNEQGTPTEQQPAPGEQAAPPASPQHAPGEYGTPQSDQGATPQSDQGAMPQSDQGATPEATPGEQAAPPASPQHAPAEETTTPQSDQQSDQHATPQAGQGPNAMNTPEQSQGAGQQALPSQQEEQQQMPQTAEQQATPQGEEPRTEGQEPTTEGQAPMTAEEQGADQGAVTADIQFPVGSAKVPADSTQELGKIVDFAKENPDAKIEVSGFTDATGSQQLNEKLSEKRADNVKQMLIDQGVDSDRIEAKGMGEAQDKEVQGIEGVTGADASNRRVAVRVIQSNQG